MPTVFFAASPDELAVVAATHADPTAMLAALDTVAAGDLDPAQLIDLDLLVTGNDPAEVREAVLTPAHEGPDDNGGTVLLPVRPALGSRLAHLSDHDVDALAERWAAADGAADGGWDAYRCGQLLRSLSLLALLAGADQRGLFVRFDS
ncbi:hypothetical protein GCM10009839_60340 [Catenulispora yoronensis]|uniref:DUF1877 family protein n=1 Tax=Catenulispora yoronensis TaxID=450799 RepID=A0ABN2V1E6_9ACTN